MKQPLTVITGADQGIGLELARQFCENGHKLLLVSGSDLIFEVQEELTDQGYTVEAVKVNIGTYSGIENLYQQILKQDDLLDNLVINTQEGRGGDFSETDLKEEIDLININLISTVHLMKRLVPIMRTRGDGKIMITSIAPSPYEAVYDAQIAFLNSFADTIRNEVKNFNVGVTLLVPEAGSEAKLESDLTEVAKLAYEAMMAGREKVFSGSILAKLQGVAMKLLPEKARIDLMRSIHH